MKHHRILTSIACLLALTLFTGTSLAEGLHEAVWHGDIAKVRQLIAHGADIDAQSGNGVTPWDMAKGNGTKTMAALLRKHGAKD